MGSAAHSLDTKSATCISPLLPEPAQSTRLIDSLNVCRNQMAAVRSGLAAASSTVPSLTQSTSGHTGTPTMKTEWAQMKHTGGERKCEGSDTSAYCGSDDVSGDEMQLDCCSRGNAPEDSSNWGRRAAKRDAISESDSGKGCDCNTVEQY